MTSGGAELVTNPTPQPTSYFEEDNMEPAAEDTTHTMDPIMDDSFLESIKDITAGPTFTTHFDSAGSGMSESTIDSTVSPTVMDEEQNVVKSIPDINKESGEVGVTGDGASLERKNNTQKSTKTL